MLSSLPLLFLFAFTPYTSYAKWYTTAYTARGWPSNRTLSHVGPGRPSSDGSLAESVGAATQPRRRRRRRRWHRWSGRSYASDTVSSAAGTLSGASLFTLATAAIPP
ncbi:hypothetical protein LZ30DRAFT_686311 [Colletotrichum cereale]|nr:hypothetical protein LZ30DRAFT_686311 [Colletotrichum cereale]